MRPAIMPPSGSEPMATPAAKSGSEALSESAMFCLPRDDFEPVRNHAARKRIRDQQDSARGSSWALKSLRAAPGQHIQSNACTPLLDKPKDLCGLARQIDDDPACLKLRCRTSIHDPDTGGPTVRQVRDAKPCAERIAGVSRDHRVHIEAAAARSFPAVEFLAVVGGQPFSGLQNRRRAATWRCRRDPRGAAWKTGTQTHDHDPDGSSHALRSVAGPVHDGQIQMGRMLLRLSMRRIPWGLNPSPIVCQPCRSASVG